MTENKLNGVSRRGLLGVFAATALVAAPTYTNAFGLLKGAGDIRRIRMYSGRTGESIDTIYWIEGEYIPEVVKEINHFMRDWRSDGPAQFRHHGRRAPPDGHERALYALVGLPLAPDQRHAAVEVGRRCQELAPHEGPGGRSAAVFAVGRANGQGRCGLLGGGRRQVFPVELRPHGLRPGPQLGRLKAETLMKMAPPGAFFVCI
jgi:Bacterial protein of unknown function (DUF882)